MYDYESREQEREEYKKKLARRKKKIVGASTFAIIIVAALILSMMSFERIKPGYAAIVYSPNGGIQEQALTQGWRWIGLFKKSTQYTIATEQGYMSADKREGSEGDDSFLVPTKTGKTVNVDLEYSYNFNIEKLPILFTTFRGQEGKTIEETFMRGKIKTWAGEVTAQYDVLDIFGSKRADINAALTKHLQSKFSDYGINISSANFSRIGLDPETEKAIQERVNAEQALAKITTDKKIAEETAAKNMIEAKGAKEVKMVNASAEAESNAKIASSVNANLLEIKRLEALKAQYEAQAKWPVNTYIQGEGTNPIVNIPPVPPVSK